MVEQLPDTLDGAVRWFLGGTVVFALGFEGVTMAFGGQFLLSGLSFIIAMGLLAFMASWPPGGSLILLVVAVALLSFLGTLEFCKRRALTWKPKMLIVGIGLMVIAVLCAGIGGAILVVGVRSGTPIQAAQQSPKAHKSETAVSRDTGYLKDVNIYPGYESKPQPVNPRFVARFARSGQRARFYVEDRYYPHGLLGGIPGRIRVPQVLIGEYKDFVANDSIDIAILTPFEVDGRKAWRWGPSNGPSDPKLIFQPSADHQGRIVIIIDDAPAFYFYFVVDPMLPQDAVPEIVGQQRFDFMKEWESEGEQQK